MVRMTQAAASLLFLTQRRSPSRSVVPVQSFVTHGFSLSVPPHTMRTLVANLQSSPEWLTSKNGPVARPVAMTDRCRSTPWHPCVVEWSGPGTTATCNLQSDVQVFV
ncbi:hypothetical protein J6590_005198 [Homalodisca vitripennis]|nr:hypothetical protein J6590_005198 [Homalodisca vitripennis]